VDGRNRVAWNQALKASPLLTVRESSQDPDLASWLASQSRRKEQ